jgi:hypothetical protein
VKKTIFALLAGAALTVGAGAASAATLIGSYWVGAGPLWYVNFPQTAYSPLDAAVLLFGPGSYYISTSSTIITHTGWADGYGTSEHLKIDWTGTGGAGTPVAENFLPRPTYDNFGAFSAYIGGDREAAFSSPTGPNASINYVFAAVPEPASWALMIAGFGLVGTAMRRRKVAIAA